MKQVPYPEEGDKVFFNDERTGTVDSESPVSMGEGDWQVGVEDIRDRDGLEMVDEDDQTEPDVSVAWNSEKDGWVEA